MNLAVAIGAGPEREHRGWTPSWRMGQRGMPGLAVALLAQQRRPLTQHGRMGRAVRLMAQATVLAGRRVLPQKWTTLVGMAVGADLIGQRTLDQRRLQCAVSRVAVAAAHVAAAQGMG